MTKSLTKQFTDALGLPGTVKIIATTDENGTIHLEENDSIHIDKDGRVVLFELNEYSRTNRNLVRSIWFGSQVTIYVRAGQHYQFQAAAKPYKAIISGPRFETEYRKQLEKNSDNALSTIWLIDIAEPSDEDPDARRERENRGRQPLIHLDRIARA